MIWRYVRLASTTTFPGWPRDYPRSARPWFFAGPPRHRPAEHQGWRRHGAGARPDPVHHPGLSRQPWRGSLSRIEDYWGLVMKDLYVATLKSAARSADAPTVRPFPTITDGPRCPSALPGECGCWLAGARRLRSERTSSSGSQGKPLSGSIGAMRSTAASAGGWCGSAATRVPLLAWQRCYRGAVVGVAALLPRCRCWRGSVVPLLACQRCRGRATPRARDTSTLPLRSWRCRGCHADFPLAEAVAWQVAATWHHGRYRLHPMV